VPEIEAFGNLTSSGDWAIAPGFQYRAVIANSHGFARLLQSLVSVILAPDETVVMAVCGKFNKMQKHRHRTPRLLTKAQAAAYFRREAAHMNRAQGSEKKSEIVQRPQGE